MSTPTELIEKLGSCWVTEDLRRDVGWRLVLTKPQMAAATAAIEALEDRDPLSIHPGDVDLGALKEATDAVGRALTPGTGHGFAVMSRLPVEQYTERQVAQLFWVIGLEVGEPVSQNRAGDYLCHVRRDADVSHRGYATDNELQFHSDMSEISALLCLEAAQSGGESAVVSFAAVHDRLGEERPDLLEVLYRPFYFGRVDQDPWEPPFSIQPVFARSSMAWGGYYNRHSIENAEGREGIPPLTDRQREALEAVLEVANRPELCFQFAMRPGEVLFVHNAMVMHARTSFEDDPDQRRWRHLLRLWLQVPSERNTIPWAVRHDIRYGNRGLVRRRGDEPTV